MGNCCDPKAPKTYTLMVDGKLVGLIGVDQAFLDVSGLGLVNEEVAEKLLEIVARRNYIVEGAQREYKIALLAAYNNNISESR